MVFVDAISTGYSRVVAGVNAAQYHGQQGDLRAFGEFINEYLKTASRWPSPKFLIGESYGTIRSAGLSQELQVRHGIELNGIVLVSSLLTYQTILTSPQNDVAYVSYFPTYVTTAWYHKRLAAGSAGEGHQARGRRGARLRHRRVRDDAAEGELARATPSGRRWRRRSRA